jgi:hypothetical protein
MSDMTSRPPDFEIAPAANDVASSAANSAAREIIDSANRAGRVGPAMTAFQAIRAGMARAVGSVRLVMLVWFVFVALAWIAALPAWRWFDSVLSLAPEGDRLLSGLNIALLRELTHYDRSPTMTIAMGSASMFFVLALVLNPFIAGGTLGVLGLASAAPDAPIPSPRGSGERARVRGVTQRFGSEGMRWYWRFARILLLVGMLGGGVTLVLTTAFEAAGAAFDERGWPRASMWTENIMLLMSLVMFGLSSLIVDVSRIFLIRRDDGRSAAAVKQALGFLWRNLGAVIAIGGVFVAILAAAIAIYSLIAGSITPLSWGLLLFTIVWQQLFALARTTLRIGQLAAFADLIDAREPRPIERPVDVAPIDEPVYELPMLG